MLNKKVLGLGMMVIGGVVTVAGAIITKKAVKESKNDLVEAPCGMSESCGSCGYCDYYDNAKSIVDDEVPAWCKDNEENLKECDEIAVEAKPGISFEVPATATEFEPHPEQVSVFASYNPAATPISMTQEDIESVGQNTF